MPEENTLNESVNDDMGPNLFHIALKVTIGSFQKQQPGELSVTGGGRTTLVLYEPLQGGSLEGRMTEANVLQERSRGSLMSGVDHEKVPPHGFSEGHAGPAATSPPLTVWLHSQALWNSKGG